MDSYAGFSGDSPVLEPLWTRALAGQRLYRDLPVHVNGKLYAYIDSGEEAQRRSWRGTPQEKKAYYQEQRASLRPGTYARLHENRWQSGEEAFLTGDQWDACVERSLSPVLPDKKIALWVGVDAATKSDSAAVVAVTRDGARLRLALHRIWKPKPGDPIDLEATIEGFVLNLHAGFRVRTVRYDPYQMARSAATLKAKGVPMEEFPQTVGNLTASGQSLFDAIKHRNLALYRDGELRQQALNAVAVDTGRGWRLAKEKASKKIDAIASLSFAVLAASLDPVLPVAAMVEAEREGPFDEIFSRPRLGLFHGGGPWQP